MSKVTRDTDKITCNTRDPNYSCPELLALQVTHAMITHFSNWYDSNRQYLTRAGHLKRKSSALKKNYVKQPLNNTCVGWREAQGVIQQPCAAAHTSGSEGTGGGK